MISSISFAQWKTSKVLVGRGKDEDPGCGFIVVLVLSGVGSMGVAALALFGVGLTN